MKIYKVTQNQYKKLLESGSITVNNIEYTYDSSAIYIITDPGAPEYSLSNDSDCIYLTRDGEIQNTINLKDLQTKHSSTASVAYSLRYGADDNVISGNEVVNSLFYYDEL